MHLRFLIWISLSFLFWGVNIICSFTAMNSAGAIIFNRTGEVMVFRRVDKPNAWQFPQGGIEAADNNEDDVGRCCAKTAAALRELREETGIIVPRKGTVTPLYCMSTSNTVVQFDSYVPAIIHLFIFVYLTCI